ncbi:hypothetical protein BUV99_13430, partial [Corynebacterium diphtheriae]
MLHVQRNIHRLERNCDIRIKVALSDSDLNIPTATNIWPNANW